MALLKAVLVALALRFSIANAQGNVCRSNKYSSYVSVLSDYKPALSYCTTKYPVAPVVSTTTTIVPRVTTVTDTTITMTETATAANARKVRRQQNTAKKSSAFASLTRQAVTFQKTACSCIETPSTVLSTTTVTRGRTTVHTTATTTTTTTITPTPTPRCNNGEYTTPSQSFQIKCGYIYNSDYLRYLQPATDIYDCVDKCVAYEQGLGSSFDKCCGVSYRHDQTNCFLLIPSAQSTCPTDAQNPDAQDGYDVAIPEGVNFG